MKDHPDNDHWKEWRASVIRTGYNFKLARAEQILRELERLTPEQIEQMTTPIYQQM